MDSLTQIVLGAAVGEKVLGKKIGNRAVLYGAIAGTIPDLDVLVGKFLDPVTAIAIHRGFSHSVVFFLLLSPLLGWIIKKIEAKKGVSFQEGFNLMFWCLFTHALLDAFTTWGTQILWPLEYRFAFKSIFVIDPLYTLPFLCCLIAAMRKSKTDSKRRKWNNLGLVISTSYLLLTVVLKGLAYQKFTDALEQQNISYKEMITKPAPLNTILWNANIETEEAFLLADYSFFDTESISFNSYPKNHHLIEAYKQDETLAELIEITEGWYTISQANGRLFLNDLRFGLLNQDEKNPQFVFSYKLTKTEKGIEAEEVEKDRRDAKKLLAELWNRIWGN